MTLAIPPENKHLLTPTTRRSQPDGVQRGLVGNIIGRFEQRGFKLIALKLVHASPEHLEKRTSPAKSGSANLIPLFDAYRLRRPEGQALLPWSH